MCHLRKQPLSSPRLGRAPGGLPAFESLAALDPSTVDVGISVAVPSAASIGARDGGRRSRRHSTPIAALLAADESAALAKISVPTLVLCATRDRVVSEAATMRIMRGVPHARRVDVDGPHLLLKTRPRECAAAVLEFILEVRRAGPAVTGPTLQ